MSAFVLDCEGSDLVRREGLSHHDDGANESLELLGSEVADAFGEFERVRLIWCVAGERVFQFCGYLVGLTGQTNAHGESSHRAAADAFALL